VSVCDALCVCANRGRHLPCERDVSRAARLAVGPLRAIIGLSLVAVDIARAVVVLLVRMLQLLLLLLLLLSDLTVRDRRNGSEPMRRVHVCKAAACIPKWTIAGAWVPQSGMTRPDLWRRFTDSLRVFLVSRSADNSLLSPCQSLSIDGSGISNLFMPQSPSYQRESGLRTALSH